MRPYAALVTSRFLTVLQYRSAALAGILTQLFFGGVRMMVFEAFYASGREVPLSRADAISYIWLAQTLFRLVMLGPDPDVAQLVKTGGIAYELTRPIDLYGTWFARAAATRAAYLLLRGTPVFVIAALALGLRPPATLEAALLFVVAVILALAIASSIAVLLTVSLLWTVSGEGLARLVAPVVFVLSGIMIPLSFFPDSLQTALAILPFRGIMDTPFRIYLGLLAGQGALAALLHQAAWLAAIVLLGRALLARGLRRLVVQGG